MYRTLIFRRAVCATSIMIFGTLLCEFFVPRTQAQSPSIQVMATEGKFQELANSDFYYYFDREGGTISPLELQSSKAKTTHRDLGLEVWGEYMLAGGRSPFRIKSGQPLEFLIRFAPGFGGIRKCEEAVKAYVFLSPARSRKDRREVVTVQWPFIGRPRINEDKILCDVKTYGDASVLVRPHKSLPVGEYAFMFSDLRYSSLQEEAFFAFGIDPPGMN